MWVKYKDKRINLLQVRKYEPNNIIGENKEDTFYLIEIDELELIDEFTKGKLIIPSDYDMNRKIQQIQLTFLDLDKELERLEVK